MKKHETVRPMTDNQKDDLAKAAFEAVPPEMSFDDADAVLSNKGPLVAELRSVYEKYAPSSLANRQLAAWRKIYRDHFGIELGPVIIPTHRKGFDRLIVVAKGVTIEQAYKVCSGLFPCWRSTNVNLDKAVPTNDRTSTNGDYAIWVRDRIEADEELKNLSANQLAATGLQTITLLERILFELIWFVETKGHLDVNNVSLCAGSRSDDGSVPSADWGDGMFYVNADWYGPGNARDDLRGRQVVS